MSSTLAWMDHDEEERKRMLDALRVFRFRDTRDELGLGAIRDAFSELLFPGTSTIQTRPRYFLLVPWCMLRLERARVPSARAAPRARDIEADLIRSLQRGGNPEGVLGRDAGANLQRMPSAVYWGGLGSYRIRRIPGSMADYFRSLDRLYLRRQATRVRAEGDELYEREEHTFDPNLPAEPDDLWQATTLDMLPAEAEYLKERIVMSYPNSLLAHLLLMAPGRVNVSAPWKVRVRLPARLEEILHHARLFSEVMHGAALRYNLELARSAVSLEITGHTRRLDEYSNKLGAWSARLTASLDDVAAWDRSRFWGLVAEAGFGITPSTQAFVETWIDLVLHHDGLMADNSLVREHIVRREQHVKRRLARWGNRERLERWTGRSGTDPLTFRWPTVRRVLIDIREGLGRA